MLIVGETTKLAASTVQRDKGQVMTALLSTPGRTTLGGDKKPRHKGGIAAMRQAGVAPHLSRQWKGWSSAIDRWTMRHAAYAVGKLILKRIKEVFFRRKKAARLRRVRQCGLQPVRLVLAVGSHNTTTPVAGSLLRENHQ